MSNCPLYGWDDYSTPIKKKTFVLAYFPCDENLNSLIVLNEFYKKITFHVGP